jgi:hypothetical protein
VGDPGKGIVGSSIFWDPEPVTISADEALRATDDSSGSKASAEAEEFLRDKLSCGPAPAKEAEEHARALGISTRTLRRARKKLGVIPARESEGTQGHGRWLWSLPQGGQKSSKVANSPNGPLAPSLAPLQSPPPVEPIKVAPERPLSDWDAVGDIPDFLDRRPPRLGPPAICSGPDDDLGDFR